MTVTYTSEVATCRGLSSFLKLLVRWKGSIYKLVYIDLIIFLLIYYILHITYKFVLNEDGKETFERVVKFCDSSSNYIPLSFILGFYVSIVMTRWWNQYLAIAFPDPVALLASAVIHGHDERGRILRRTLMRYVCLAITMIFISISPKVKKRFPTLTHLVDAGLLHDSEREILDGLNKKFPAHTKYWVALVWASSIVTRARKEGRIHDDFTVKALLGELNHIRDKCALLGHYDRISIPLVYTQVVTLAVYSYFLTAVVGRQGVDDEFEMYFPIFTLLQFFFYMGWLKVAESLINPFGDDDDDFELNWMVDRNLQVSYLLVDEMHNSHPEIIRDQYWDDVLPSELPYTREAAKYKEMHPYSSTANLYLEHKNKRKDSADFGHYISFPASRRNSRYGSQHSILSNKSNSVTNLLRKILAPGSNAQHEDGHDHEMLGKVPKHIIEGAIEEVDEQLTHIARREEPRRPSAKDAFQPYEKTGVRVHIEEPNEEVDHLSAQLKSSRREEERLKEIKQNLTKYLEKE